MHRIVYSLRVTCLISIVSFSCTHLHCYNNV